MLSTGYGADVPTMERIFFKDTGLFARNQLTVEIGPNDEIGNGQFVGD